jgi:hypothetical protein
VQRAGRQIDIHPTQRQQLALAHAGGEGYDIERREPITRGRYRLQEGACVVRREHVQLASGRAGESLQRRHVALHEAQPERLAQRHPEHRVHLADGGRCDTGGKLLVVELLDGLRRKSGETDAPQRRHEVLLDVLAVARDRAWRQPALRGAGEPRAQVLRHGLVLRNDGQPLGELAQRLGERGAGLGAGGGVVLWFVVSSTRDPRDWSGKPFSNCMTRRRMRPRAFDASAPRMAVTQRFRSYSRAARRVGHTWQQSRHREAQ